MEDQTLALDEVSGYCQELIKLFQSKQIVLLEGPLGAGKTQLVKECVRLLGGQESSSPTYSLINEYALGEKMAYHVDLYRIDGEDDLESVGFWDLFDFDKGLVFIEWSSRLDEAQLPLSWSKLRVTIEKTTQDQERTYRVCNL